MYIPKATRDRQYLHPHKTHPANNQQGWRAEAVHGLPAIAAPTFFPKATKNKNIWWETKTPPHTRQDDNENELMETEDEGDPPDGQDVEVKNIQYHIFGTRWMKKTERTQ